MKTAKKKDNDILPRISQCDIFKNIDILEKILIIDSKIELTKITFPYVICMNQECDLKNDYDSSNPGIIFDNQLLHLIIAPVFNFDQFLTGTHWGKIMNHKETLKKSDTKTKLICQNEIPRYHYLNFKDSSLPELIIDFKHFFTIEKSILYNNIENRLCSMDDLYKEKISQRFSSYISRIGLPD